MADIDMEPRYGAALRPLWALDPGFNTVNHGSFGATPVCVMEAQTRWRARIEAQPSRFMRRDLGPAVREAAAALARFIGADADDVTFVDNATAGCNAVLRSLDFAPGDEIVVIDHGYAAVRNAVAYVAERSRARVVTAAMPFPRPDDDAIVAALTAALSSRTRLAVIDHVTSPSAVVLPVARLTAACHAAGAPVLIDGAHAPAMLDVDVAALGAEYYTGNCHKWLMAPKGAGFLHVRRDRQQGLHPLAISHGYRQGFLAEFDWTGTTDFSAFLAVPDAIAFHERLGGLLVRDRNAALAASAAVRLAARLGTETGAPRTQPASMAVVRLPVDPALAAPEAAARLAELREAVLAAGTDAPLHAMAGAVWLRLSAAAYNDLSDYDRLADVLAAALEGYHTGV